MKTAIVILNWNGKNLLAHYLPSVLQYTSDSAEIYVADNASTDDSVTFLRENFPQVKIIQNKENYGFAKGYNEALKHIDTDVYVLLNSDVEVTENWLSPIIEYLKMHPEVAAVQPKILDYKNKEYFEYAGAGGGFIDQLGYPYCRGRIFNTIEKDSGQYNDITPIFWASGACLFIKKEAYWKAGGFDNDYFAHQEEIDLCWRLHHLNFKVIYFGKSCVYHLGGATLKAESPRKTFLNFRNSLFNLLKNAPKPQFFILILMRLFLDGIAGIRFLITLKPRHFFAIIKSHFSFYYHFNIILKKRKGFLKTNNYYYINSILINHFVLKIKYFKYLK